MARCTRAFTLVEVLVVIAVLAVLIAVLLPGLAAARESAQRVRSLSDMRSIGLATLAYAEGHHNGWFPTARMPGMGPNVAPFTESWVHEVGRVLDPSIGTLEDAFDAREIAAFVGRLEVFRSPFDESTNWTDPMMPRLGSYGINAYLTPNHPPYNGVRVLSLRRPSELVVAVELADDLAMDHVMPMYWGDPPAVVNPMIQSRQWDSSAGEPKVMALRRQRGGVSNYIFADGHASSLGFEETWEQEAGERPLVNRYEPMLP